MIILGIKASMIHTNKTLIIWDTIFMHKTQLKYKTISYLGNHGLFIVKEGLVTATFAQSLVVGDNLIISNSSNTTQV